MNEDIYTPLQKTVFWCPAETRRPVYDNSPVSGCITYWKSSYAYNTVRHLGGEDPAADAHVRLNRVITPGKKLLVVDGGHRRYAYYFYDDQITSLGAPAVLTEPNPYIWSRHNGGFHTLF